MPHAFALNSLGTALHRPPGQTRDFSSHPRLQATSLVCHKSQGSYSAGSEDLNRQETRATTSQEYYNFPQAQTMASFPSAAHDAFSFSDLLTEEEQRIRMVTRDFMVRVTQMCQVCSCARQLAVP